MHENQKILTFVFLLFLVSSVSAAIDLSASTIHVGTGRWLVANGSDSTSIEVLVQAPPLSPVPVAGANVTYTLDPGSTDLGTITPPSFQTGADGLAPVVFHTSKKSGTAAITATITHPDPGTTPVMLHISIPVDHDTPEIAAFDFPETVSAGSVVPLTVTSFDSFNNPIDDKNPSETHSVRLTMAGDGGSGFWDGTGYVPQITKTTDVTGNISVMVRVSTIPTQSALIEMDAIGLMAKNPFVTYKIVGDPEPWYISQSSASTTDPMFQYGSAPADGDSSHRFTVTYTVMDKYNNPINNIPLYVSSVDMVQHNTFMTNNYGAVTVSYPPQTTIGVYYLNASTSANASAVCTNPALGTTPVGFCSQPVEYFNTAPVDMALTANPQGMTSRDVDSTTQALIQAKVMDIKGNPVPGAPVYFSMGTPTYPGGPYNATNHGLPGGPTLSATTANVTGGYATVIFQPGYFASYDDKDYNATATGQVIVTATFTNTSGVVFNRDVTLVWKNYPYLGITSTSPCTNSHVGDTINVSVVLFGDGAALKPKPIDAELVMDVSGSMYTNGPMMEGPMKPTSSQYKIVYANWSGQAFVSKMDSTKDQVGLTTFTDYNDATNTKNVVHLGNQFSTVNTDLKTLIGHGNTDTRDGLKMGIDDLINHPNSNPKAIRAVILMTDGAYNDNGDPLARAGGSHKKTSMFPNNGDGTMDWYNYTTLSPAEQNLAYYAQEHNIRIYTVTFGTDAAIQPGYHSNGSSAWQIYDTMDQIAAQSGGQHFHATDGYQAADVYTTIAGLLQETAGANTEMNLNFGSVTINQIMGSNNLTQYMNYTYNVSTPKPLIYDSTYIGSYNQTPSGQIRQEMNYTRDDTADWQNKHMHFDIGTIKLNETWLTTFRLNLTKAGSIDMFGPNDTGSQISFTDASTGITSTSFIPSLQCNIREAGTSGAISANSFSLDSLAQDGISADPNILNIKWNVTYTGTYDPGTGNYPVHEDVKYQDPDVANPHWYTALGGVITRTGPLNQKTEYLTIDTSDDVAFPPGDRISIYIAGTVYDAEPSNTGVITFLKQGGVGKHYIKLE